MNGVPDNPELLLRERAWLCALARQLVRRHEVADEAAHDALATAWTQPGPRLAGPRGWLAAILRKQLAGRRRGERRRLAREQRVAQAEAVPPVSDTVARFEVQRAVADAVLALAEPYRTTVLLRFWEELTPAAISVRTQTPVETVRTRLKRGLAMLRERLDGAHGGKRGAWAAPLWVVGRRADSVTASFLLGVTLMTAMQKIVVGALVAAAGLLLWATSASPPAAQDASRDASATSPVVASSAVAAEAANATIAERSDAGQRVPVAAAATETGFLVTGMVVDDETSAPLAGVSVRLIAWPRDEATEAEAVTSPDGAFTLRDASAAWPRAAEILVQSPDHALAHAQVGPQPARDSGLRQFDAGAIRLVRGTLFSGQVVDAAGRGVGGAELVLPLVSFAYGGYGPQNMLERFAVLGRSDADGRFRLSRAIGPDVSHQNLLFAIAPQGLGWCRFQASKMRREVSDCLVRLRPNGGLRVVVSDPAGRRVAGAMVRALPRFGPLGIEHRAFRDEVSKAEIVGARFRGRTDASGEVVVPGLPIGEADGLPIMGGFHERSYDLCIEADGYPTQALTPCELQADAEVRVEVRLVATSQIVVTVDARDDLGAPVDDAVVEVSGAATTSARTDAAGRAVLTTDVAPSLRVSARAPGHAEAKAVFEMKAGQTSNVVALVLPRTRALDGIVLDQLGQPAAGMSLAIDGQFVGRTGDDGRFRIADCPMGTRRLVVVLAQGMDRTRWTGEQSPESIDADRGPVTIVMQRRLGQVDVRAVIVDAATGEALEPTRAVLRLYHEKGGNYLEQKELQVARGLVTAKGTPAGRWRLDVVTATGHRGAWQFELVDGQPPVEHRMELSVPGTITGRLQFTGVSPPAEVTLSVDHATPDRTSYVQYRYPGRWFVEPVSQTVTDNQVRGTGVLHLHPALDSSFRLDSVDPDDTLVFRVRGDGVTGEARVRVEPGRSRDLVIEVRAKAN